MPAIRGQDSKKKTRRHTRDLDQIHDDLHKEKHLEKYKSTKAAEDLPGLGQFYWKASQAQLKEEPYSQKEAEAAAGLTWTDNGKRKEDDEMAEAT
ncbi:unnamed protein product [Aureobasidium pullulans]|nr:unnamed protein product [Aureobasidium pullulans]